MDVLSVMTRMALSPSQDFFGCVVLVSCCCVVVVLLLCYDVTDTWTGAG